MMKRLFIIFTIIITSCNISKPQSVNHPYFLFSGDTTLNGVNKNCRCFIEFQFFMNELEKSQDDSNEYTQIYKSELLSKYKNFSVGEMLNDLSKKYIFIDTTLIAYKRGDYDKNENIIDVLDIGGIWLNLYIDKNYYLTLTIDIDYKNQFRIPLNEVDTTSILNNLFKHNKFCAYISKNEINKEILACEKAFKGTIKHPYFEEKVKKLEKLREKMKKITESKGK